MDTPGKMVVLRSKREEQYELLKDAVYKGRGWTSNGIPTVDRVHRPKLNCSHSLWNILFKAYIFHTI
jgi:hypothetical protein